MGSFAVSRSRSHQGCGGVSTISLGPYVCLRSSTSARVKPRGEGISCCKRVSGTGRRAISIFLSQELFSFDSGAPPSRTYGTACPRSSLTDELRHHNALIPAKNRAHGVIGGKTSQRGSVVPGGTWADRSDASGSIESFDRAIQPSDSPIWPTFPMDNGIGPASNTCSVEPEMIADREASAHLGNRA